MSSRFLKDLYDARYEDSIYNDTFYKNSLYKDLIYKDILYKDILYKDILYKDILYKDILYNDLLYNDLLYNDLLYNDRLFNDLLNKDTLYNDLLYEDRLCEDSLWEDLLCEDPLLMEPFNTTPSSLTMDAYQRARQDFLHRENLLLQRLLHSQNRSASKFEDTWRQPALQSHQDSLSHIEPNNSSVASPSKFQLLVNVKHFKADEVDVKIVDGFVVVTAKHVERPDEDGFISRSYIRRYKLPDDVESDKVTSFLGRDGVLTIKAPTKVPAFEGGVNIPIKIHEPVEEGQTQSVLEKNPVQKIDHETGECSSDRVDLK